MPLWTVLLCAGAIACANSPVAPAAMTAAPTAAAVRLTLGCSGQSNAVSLCFGADTSRGSFLSPYADVVGFAEGSRSIDLWDVGWDCWTRLDDQLRANQAPLSAMIWWQGEADAQRPVGYYRAKLAGLAARIRVSARSPNLRMLIVQLGGSYLRADFTISGEQEAFVASDGGRAAIVKTDDLPFLDGAHMGDEGYTKVAARIYQLVKP